MAMKLFGFEIKKEKEPELPSIVPATHDDGSLIVAGGGSYGSFLDLDANAKSEADMITKYWDISLQPECDHAIDEIVNEVIVKEDDSPVVQLNTDNLPYSDKIKNQVRDEFNNIIKILNFNNTAYEHFRKWYISGRSYYHVVIDPENPQEGIKDIRYIDPRKIRKVRVVQKKPVTTTPTYNNVFTTSEVDEFFIFNEKGFYGNTQNSNVTTTVDTATSGVKISKDSIIYCPSGLTTSDGKTVLSYLQKAIKPLNSLRMLEDSLVIYFLTRSPERRVFNVDVGGLPRTKAEQYLSDTMTRFKNKVVYDAKTGEVRDDRKYTTMTEDFWFAKREGGKGTEVNVLPGGAALPDQLESVVYYRQKLYKALNIPISRIDNNDGFNLGRATEISRDELKFQKFIIKLRTKFSKILLDALGKQLLLKGVCTLEDWDEFKDLLHVQFSTDNYFSELKNGEILRERLNNLNMIQPYIGQFFSTEWVWKNIIMMTDEEIEEMSKQMSQETPIIQAQQDNLVANNKSENPPNNQKQ